MVQKGTLKYVIFCEKIVTEKELCYNKENVIFTANHSKNRRNYVVCFCFGDNVHLGTGGAFL